MFDAVARRQATCQAKGEFARVDIVVATVVKRRLDVNHWIAGDNTAVQRFADTFLHRRAILLRNHAALDFVDKFETFARLVRLKSHPNVTVLTAAAGLFGVLTLHFGSAANGFAESNLRLADVSFDVKFALHTVNQNFQVQLAHAAHNRLTSLFVGVNAESRVFFG